jgi:alpha-mannosidase
MRLTLLRSPKAPDENADMGEQRFTYSILPFSGSFGDSGLVRKGYELNDPAVVEAGGNASGPVKPAAAEYSLFTIDGKAVIAESVKAPESGRKKTLVLRLYESLGGRVKTVVRFNREIASAAAVDMLEDNPKNLRFSGRNLALDFRGFEIKTVMVALK